MPTKVKLDAIRSLTFYKDTETDSRRGSYLPQLNCIGKPCRLYTPDVVRCVNAGGSGTEVDWKCEADLPEALRFGRVEVSCEGWSGPGDKHVMKESCSLDYRLVEVPGELRGKNNYPSFKRPNDLAGTLFSLLWFAVLAFIVYSFFRSCTRSGNRTGAPPTGHHPGGGGSRGGFPGTWGSGSDTSQPPPPYSKNAPGSHQTGADGGWRPGFWTGALAGVGANMLNNYWRNGDDMPRRRTWDWERERAAQTGYRPAFSSGFGGGRSRWGSDDDRGEGSSSGGLGSMRRSTGLGGSNVR